MIWATILSLKCQLQVLTHKVKVDHADITVTFKVKADHADITVTFRVESSTLLVALVN